MSITRNHTQGFPHIRWLIRRDLPAVLRIEDASFRVPWTEDEFVRSLRLRNVIGMVAEHQDMVIGYMIYELHRDSIHLLSIAVHPDFRRQGVGAAMLAKLVSKLYQRRGKITTLASEINLDAQVFLREYGFRATEVVKDHYRPHEDAYFFVYRQPVTASV
jgi:ribosomal-protein-alanine N-acetyltransferase